MGVMDMNEINRNNLSSLPLEKRLQLIERISGKIATYPPQVIRDAKLPGERGKSEIGRAMNNPLNYYGAMLKSREVLNQRKKENEFSQEK